MTDINRDIDHWTPENEEYWQQHGKAIALRNLRWSVVILITAFMVWLMWSGLVVYLGDIREDFTVSQLYWLTALPLLSAAFLRIIYSFMIPVFGGRNWSVFSTGITIVPLIGTYFCFSYEAPYWLFAVIALLTGLAGANFASSSANISFLFPHKHKGIALGINAAIGNMGVGLIQLLIPYMIAYHLGSLIDLNSFYLPDGSKIQPQMIPLILGVLVVVLSIGAWFRMNNIRPVKSSFSEQKHIFRDKHLWIMSILYTFTFGSFIGFASALPILIDTLFHRLDFTVYAFAGALLSSLMRPLGHLISKIVGAVHLTLFVFLTMTVGLLLLLKFIPQGDDPGSFFGFMAAYMVIFIGTGLGKGSTTSMIPEVYLVSAMKDKSSTDLSSDQKRLSAAKKTASVLGLTSAIATFGAFLMPKIFDVAQNTFNNIALGVWFFIICNIACLVITWWFYFRENNDNPLCVMDKNRQWIIIDKPSLHNRIEQHVT